MKAKLTCPECLHVINFDVKAFLAEDTVRRDIVIKPITRKVVPCPACHKAVAVTLGLAVSGSVQRVASA